MVKKTNIDKAELTIFYIMYIDIFKQLKEIEGFGYSRLLQKNGLINSRKLNTLIDIDIEITKTIIAIREYVHNIVHRKMFSKVDYIEVIYMVDEIISILKRRKTIFKKNM